MIVVRELTFDGGKSLGALVEHACRVAGRCDVWVLLDSYHPPQMAAWIDRYPTLAALGPAPKQKRPNRRLLASAPEVPMTDGWTAPITPEVAVQLARDIRWCNYTQFVIGPVPALWHCTEGPPRPTTIPRDPRPEDAPATIAIVRPGAGEGAIRVRVNVYMPAPARDVTQLPMPEAARVLIAKLGGPGHEHQELLPDPGDATGAKEIEPAVQSLLATFSFDAVEYPEHEPNRGELMDGELVLAFPGYRKVPSRARLKLTKRTAAHNELEILLAMYQPETVTFTIRGALWSHAWELPAHCRGPVPSGASLFRARARELAAAVAVLERDIIPELERLYWPGYAWFTPES